MRGIATWTLLRIQTNPVYDTFSLQPNSHPPSTVASATVPMLAGAFVESTATCVMVVNTVKQHIRKQGRIKFCVLGIGGVAKMDLCVYDSVRAA